MIRRILTAATLGVMTLPASAQTPEPLAQADQTTRIAQLEQQLALAVQEVQRLRGSDIALDRCRAKNERLVAIGNDLITAYGNRYRRGRDNMFQFGRTRFEKELQDKAEQMHINRHEVPEQGPPQAVPEQDTPKTGG